MTSKIKYRLYKNIKTGKEILAKKAIEVYPLKHNYIEFFVSDAPFSIAQAEGKVFEESKIETFKFPLRFSRKRNLKFIDGFELISGSFAPKQYFLTNYERVIL